MSVYLFRPRKRGAVRLTPAFLIFFLLLFLPACSSHVGSDPISPGSDTDSTLQEAQSSAGYISWGTYDLVIARDGSEWVVVPNRYADVTWGYHLNAVKLLEVSPGTNCIKIVKVDVLPNGDLAVDISIKHPYTDPAYTGFDVRGIIMFPSSQYVPDNELLEQAGLPPCGLVWYSFASHSKGDAELVNPDGYTTIWSPCDISAQKHAYELEDGYPIFEYYEGQMASGEDLGIINGFKRYHSNENRHMFEVWKTVTRTFVIRPPSDGPIMASYAVYAHWEEPLVIPVIDPATDFGPEANSPLPYDFWIEQVGPLDPDAPDEVKGENVLWHIKYWHFGIDYWGVSTADLLGGITCGGLDFLEAFDKCPDCYMNEKLHFIYQSLPDALPGTWPVIFVLSIDNDIQYPRLATDYYIAWLDFEAFDGEW